MISLGAIVVAGAAPRIARSLDSLVRQTRPLDRVTIVVAPDIDRRVGDWLDATAAARGWTVVREPCTALGAMFDAGLAATPTEWFVALEAGDVLVPSAAAALETAITGAHEPADVIVGAARLVALGVDETACAEAPADLGALDPAHPALRSICWRRAAVDASGGFDPDLAAAVRYDLWLRLIARGGGGQLVHDSLVRLSVDTGEPLPAELNAGGYRDAVRAVLARHAGLLATRVGDVLEGRARRVTALGPRHLRALERHRVVQEQSEAERRDETLPAVAGALPGRTSPLSRSWGYDRGGPLDRVFIERFVREHAADIRGAVLEVQEADYTRRFGGSAVERSDVVDLAESNAGATVITDLRAATNIQDAAYDCVILTQTLHVIAPMAEVVAECHRILKPGGVLLVTLPCVSRVCLEYGRDGDFWRVTPAGARQLFEPAFGEGVAVSVFGNALSGAAFLYGLGLPEVDERDLAVTDIYNPTLVGVRAVKSGLAAKAPSLTAGRHSRGLVLLYHRVGGAGPDPHRVNLDLTAFERQMAWLASDCAVLPLDELVEGANRRTLPNRAVALTFDDGYLDTLTNATPILLRHMLPATCFVATEGLDGSHVFWWDRLAVLLLGDGSRPDSLTLDLPDGPRRLATTTPGERLFAHGLVYHAIVALPAAARDGVLAQVAAWAPGAAVDQKSRRMSAGELRALAGQGISIGAHTVHHPQLPRQAHATQVREMADSRVTLERIAGIPVTHLAYPFGAFDDTTVAAAVEAGLTHAFTCEPRALAAADPPLRLPRLDPQEPLLERFAARVVLSLESGV
ncbi:MAG: polysaccharide deacetylase family protein [Vicinamibacteria bacterium]|nr:polysaccharide deacetylase family protein [Vicinamibacteria bacterium]